MGFVCLFGCSGGPWTDRFPADNAGQADCQELEDEREEGDDCHWGPDHGEEVDDAFLGRGAQGGLVRRVAYFSSAAAVAEEGVARVVPEASGVVHGEVGLVRHSSLGSVARCREEVDKITPIKLLVFELKDHAERARKLFSICQGGSGNAEAELEDKHEAGGEDVGTQPCALDADGRVAAHERGEEGKNPDRD